VLFLALFEQSTVQLGAVISGIQTSEEAEEPPCSTPATESYSCDRELDLLLSTTMQGGSCEWRTVLEEEAHRRLSGGILRWTVIRKGMRNLGVRVRILVMAFHAGEGCQRQAKHRFRYLVRTCLYGSGR
jgi:hypothetical protein